MKLKPRFLLYLLGLTIFKHACADIGGDLKNFFNESGFSSNITAPQAVEGQSAGYYTGGSLFARTSVRNYQIASFTPPSWRTGCGGVDFFSGGFSHINADEAVKMMRNILNNAIGYAFMLAMEEATPQMTNVLKYMHNLANEINALTINSCEAGASLVGSVWPKTQVAQAHICADIGSSKNIFKDRAASRHGCNTGGKMSEILNEGKKDERFKDMILANTNIAWQAINKNSFLKNDQQLAEFFMSLSGTIIVKKSSTDDDANIVTQLLESKISDQNLLKALMYGDKAKIYKCDAATDGKVHECLNPTEKEVEITPENGLVNQVKKQLEAIAIKIHEDTALTDGEKGFLNSVRLPIYKILNVQAAFFKNANTLGITDYSETIAADILFRYLDDNLSQIRAGTAQLQYPEHIMEKFVAGIGRASSKIRTMQQTAYHQISESVQLIQQTQVLEQMLSGELAASTANNLEWARGLK